MFYVYVIVNSVGKLYIGYSTDLRRRIKEHNEGQSRYTKADQWKLVYYEAYQSKSDAQRREKRLKQGGQAIRHLKERIKESITLSVLG